VLRPASGIGTSAQLLPFQCSEKVCSQEVVQVASVS
jgi:hypothetical protein